MMPHTFLIGKNDLARAIHGAILAGDQLEGKICLLPQNSLDSLPDEGGMVVGAHMYVHERIRHVFL